MSTCDLVAERIALGEALGELAAHAETCERCRRVADMTTKLGATHHEVDPGLGFAARMTVGAQERLSIRRRRRVVATAAGTVTAAALAVLLVTRTGDQPAARPAVQTAHQQEPEHIDPSHDEDLAALVNLADVDRSRRLSANWRRIEQPLAPYRTLFKQVAASVKREAAKQGAQP
jgi:hypothetical protein